MTNPGNNGVFTIASVGAGTFTVANAGGANATGQTGIGRINGSVAAFDATTSPPLLLVSSNPNPITVGPAPVALAVTLDSSKVYVANTLENSASVINTTTFASAKISVSPVPAGTTATWLTVSKEGTRAYLTLVDPADVGSGTAIIITASNLPLTDPNNGNAPVLIAPTPQDLTSACVVYGPPSNCATVGKQRPVQIVPRL